MTLSITTLFITTLSRKGLEVTFSLMILSITIRSVPTLFQYAECHYAECRMSFYCYAEWQYANMLNIIMLSVLAPYFKPSLMFVDVRPLKWSPGEGSPSRYLQTWYIRLGWKCSPRKRRCYSHHFIFFVTYEWAQKAVAFVPNKPFLTLWLWSLYCKLWRK